MKNFERKQILPALLRPGMYTGEQGDRTTAEWHADAVAEYLNAVFELQRRNSTADANEEGDPLPICVRL